MAADLETKPAPPKYAAFIEQQVNRVQRKIRTLDIGRSLLSLAVLTLGYGLLMGILDLAFKGAESGLLPLVRWALFVGFAVGAVYFLGQAAVRFYRRINPYFAARQLEETLPNAKNSVINYLDLRDEELPPVIMGAVGLRAAKDLKQTDPDKAVDSKSNLLLGGMLLGLILGLLILLAISPGQFTSLMRRAFVPFKENKLDTSTKIQLLEPEGGDILVPLNQRVQFRAKITGRFPALNRPGAPRLLYRYNQADNFVEQPLEEDNDATWTTVRLGDQVQNGFWYKLTAGDAETPEYQVKVRSLPQATRFVVAYKFRPYRKLKDETIQFPNEQAVFPRILGQRGTVATVTVHTNRQLKDGDARLELEFQGGGKKDLVGEILADDPTAFQCRWTLEKSGHFRVYFKSAEGEDNTDRAAYTVEVQEDLTPQVVLTKPGEDVERPINGTVEVEGFAQDDFGVKALALNFKIVEGIPHDVAAQPYRPKKKFEFDDGGLPLRLDFKDLIALDKLRTADGKDLILHEGSVLEYWLEATDNSDLVKGGNVGKSQAYKIKVLAPQDPKKQQEERKRAEEEKNKHDKKQDQDHAQKNEERKNQPKNSGEQPKEQDPQAKAEQEKREKDLQDQADKLKEKLEKQEKDEQKGTGKGEEGPQAEAKQGGAGKDGPKGDAKDNKPKQPEQAGNQKNEGDKKEGQNAGQARDGGAKQDPKQSDQGQARGAGDQPPQPQAQGKDGKDNNDPKNGPQPQAKDGGQGKMEPGAQGAQPQAKNEGAGPQGMNEPKQGAQAKGDDGMAQAKGEPKGGQQGQAKAGEKDAKPGAAPQAGAKGEPGMDAKGNQAANKTGGNEQANNAGQSRPDPQAQPKRDGTAEDVAKLQDQLKRKEQAEDAARELSRLAKQAKDDQVRQAAKDALAKDGRDQAGRKAGDPMAQDPQGQPRREPTAEDIAKLKDLLKRAEQSEEAAQELARLAKEAKDEKIQQAAKEALAKDGRDTGPGRTKKEEGPDGPMAKGEGKKGEQGMDKGMDMGNEPGQAREGNGKEGQGQGKGQGEGEPKQGNQGQAGTKPGNFGPGGDGLVDNLKPMDANPDFARRGGNLQLEDLMKQATPDKRRKAGIHEAEWQKFLQDAQAHERWLQQNQANLEKVQPGKVQGATSKLPGTGVRPVGSTPGQADQVTSGRALPPPEFREPQRIFTNRPRPNP